MTVFRSGSLPRIVVEIMRIGWPGMVGKQTRLAILNNRQLNMKQLHYGMVPILPTKTVVNNYRERFLNTINLVDMKGENHEQNDQSKPAGRHP